MNKILYVKFNECTNAHFSLLTFGSVRMYIFLIVSNNSDHYNNEIITINCTSCIFNKSLKIDRNYEIKLSFIIEKRRKKIEKKER